MTPARSIAGLRALDVTNGASANEALPLVIALHGRGGTAELPSLAYVRGGVRVIAPFGPHPLAGAYAWSPLSAMSHRDSELARDLAAAAARLDDAITQAALERPVLGDPILAGYSQGAMAALALAARGTRRYALVLGACWAPPEIAAALDRAHVVRLRAAHGTADEIVPLAPTVALFDAWRARGIDAALEVFPGAGHVAPPELERALAERLAEAVDRVYSRPEVALVDILLAPDVFVNASVAAGTPPEHIARRVLGKPGDKPKTTRWVMTWTRALLSKAPGFKAEMVDAQMKTIESLCEVVEVQDETPEGDWVKGLVASAKAAKLKRVVTDHPDLADKTEVDGILFVSSDAWLVEQTTPPPPPPPKKSAAPPPDKQ